LRQVFPGAAEVDRHGHQVDAQLPQAFIVSGICLRPLLSFLPFGGPLLGQLRCLFENRSYLQWLSHNDDAPLSLQ
jgi:hypothetical protein